MPPVAPPARSIPAPLAWRPRQLAAVLNVSLRTIMDMIAREQLKSFRVGRCRLITDASLREFLANAGAGK